MDPWAKGRRMRGDFTMLKGATKSARTQAALVGTKSTLEGEG